MFMQRIFIKMHEKDGVTVLVFVLHALYFKCFFPNYAKSIPNLINRKIVVIIIAKATKYY